MSKNPECKEDPGPRGPDRFQPNPIPIEVVEVAARFLVSAHQTWRSLPVQKRPSLLVDHSPGQDRFVLEAARIQVWWEVNEYNLTHFGSPASSHADIPPSIPSKLRNWLVRLNEVLNSRPKLAGAVIDSAAAILPPEAALREPAELVFRKVLGASLMTLTFDELPSPSRAHGPKHPICGNSALHEFAERMLRIYMGWAGDPGTPKASKSAGNGWVEWMNLLLGLSHDVGVSMRKTLLREVYEEVTGKRNPPGNPAHRKKSSA